MKNSVSFRVPDGAVCHRITSTTGSNGATHGTVCVSIGQPSPLVLLALTCAQTSQDLEGGFWEDSDWIEYYNVNFEDPDDLDPIARYTWYPADSFKGVFTDVYLFGTFPIAQYYFTDSDGKVERVESYLDYSLVYPGQPATLIDIQTNHYNELDQLTSINNEGMFGGLDSTYLEYNAEGLLVKTTHLTSYYSQVPEEMQVTEFNYDKNGRISSEVNKWFITIGSDQSEFEDSIAYVFTSDLLYEQRFYVHYEQDTQYRLQEIFVIDNSSDFLHTHEIHYPFNGDFFIAQRISRAYDGQEQLESILTEKAFTGQPLENSTLTKRVYEGTVSTSANMDQQTARVWVSDRTLHIETEQATSGRFSIHTTTGQLIQRRSYQARKESYDLPDVPHGMYYVVLENDNGQILSSQPLVFGY